MDVRDHTATRDGGLDQRIELLITADGELKVARGDALHLEVLARVAGKLENLNGRGGGGGTACGRVSIEMWRGRNVTSVRGAEGACA